MLFPSSKLSAGARRDWFLVPHDALYKLVSEKHGHTPKFNGKWSCQTVPKGDRNFLAAFVVVAS